MTIQSMTGFARQAGVTGSQVWSWELKSVNGRGLEVRVRAPQGFDAPAEEARRLIASAFARGQCQLNLTVARGAGAPRVRVNREALDGVLAALAGLKVPEGIRPASLDGLLALRGIVEVDEGEEGVDDALRRDLADAAPRLVASLREARAREGAALAAAITRQTDEVERLTDAAEGSPSRQPEAVRARLAAQVESLLGTGARLDPERLHQEAALLATRADIREELDRLRAHVAAVRELLASAGPVGRRLDFLAQELGREANTLCAKANDVALSRIGLDLKAAVDQFREQVQNVE